MDTWGPVVNDNFTTIDLNISGTQALSFAGANITLNSTQAKNLAFVCTGTLSANVSLIMPQTGGIFLVSNMTTGAFTLTVLTSAGGSVGVVAPQGQRTLLYNNGTNVAFATDGAIEVGMGMDYWGTVAPPRWIFPYGQALSRTTYAALFARIGTTYGAGDGSTTFNAPDKRDRASFGKGDMGGTPANRITNLSGGWEGDTLGAAGGGQTRTLLTTNLPSFTTGGNSIDHSHNYDFPNSGTSFSYTAGPTSTPILLISGLTGTSSTGGQSTTHTHTYTGASTPFGILPPGIVCNYILYCGI